MQNDTFRKIAKVFFVGASVAVTLMILFVIAVVIVVAQDGFQIG